MEQELKEIIKGYETKVKDKDEHIRDLEDCLKVSMELLSEAKVGSHNSSKKKFRTKHKPPSGNQAKASNFQKT